VAEILRRTDVMPPAMIFWGLQPAAIAFVWAASVGAIGALSGGMAAAMAVIIFTIAETLWPARQDWVQTWRERAQLIAMLIIAVVATELARLAYDMVPAGPFAPAHNWFARTVSSVFPDGVTAFAAFMIVQLAAYWIHRIQHRVSAVWRVTGHGMHHSYEKLNAANFFTNHPFEALTLVGPAAVFGIVTGLWQAAETAGALVLVVAACAHTNVRMNERWIGLIITTNGQHLHHHSSDYAQSNTNYGCASTLWDRVFGTFSAADTVALGDPMEGERTLLRRLAMPFSR
jgi:sterol desaturase/sphingolipid hydroxylase (fatty acid hydroxylase superfamily)